ncbi:MAG: ABC transporter substrate-binding protein [Gordonia sp. (in: high G+C Gram-positive bacteria)]
MTRASHVATLCAAAVCTATALTACSGGGATDGATATSDAKDTLVIAENEPPATFDPVQADNSTVDEVDLPAYNTLLTYDAASKLSGELATAWTVRPDRKTIDLTIRQGVTFHDGTPLTANDVVYTLDRAKSLNIGVASLISSYLSSKAIDGTHIEIRLGAPDAAFLAALTRVYVVNSTLVKSHAGTDGGQSWLATNDAGSGPYTLTGYSSNQSASYTQYAKYWRGFTGQAKNIEFRYVTQAATEESGLKNGDVDIAMDIPSSDWNSLDSAGFKIDKSPTNVSLYTFFNMKDATTGNKALREAISYAYNYPGHIKSILNGAGNLMNGPVSKGMLCSIGSDIGQPTYDIAKAKQIVDANHLAGTTVTMTYLQATDEMARAATLLQSELQKIGITLKLESITYPQFQQMSAKDSTRPQMSMIYAFPAFPDTSALLNQNFNSKFIGNGQNWGAYTNPEVQSLLTSAQSESDDTRRCAQYQSVEKMLTSDFATINMANSNYVTVMSSAVSGYTYQSWHHQTVDVYAISLKK